MGSYKMSSSAGGSAKAIAREGTLSELPQRSSAFILLGRLGAGGLYGSVQIHVSSTM